MKTGLMKTTMLTGAAALVSMGLASTADASHFRGGAMVPSVDANGLLTVTTTSFWRKNSISTITPNIAGAAFTGNAAVTDVTDSRFDRQTLTSTYTLSGAGTYSITGGSCCRIAGIRNRGAATAGATSTGWQMDSQITWDGSTANTPILFNFSAIDPNVNRTTGYVDNLGALSGNGGTLSYDGALNTNGGGAAIFVQTPGYVVNAATGGITIDQPNAATLLDNDAGNAGGDYLFSGNITNDAGGNGDFVEFDWLFDAVNQGGNQNLAPDVTSHVINVIVGQTVNQVVTGTDIPDGIADLVTLSLDSLVGPGVNLAAGFAPNLPGDPTTGTFTWDTTGSAIGAYLATIRGNDGTDNGFGQITINVLSSGIGIAEPATLGLFGLGLAGLGLASRRRRDS